METNISPKRKPSVAVGIAIWIKKFQIIKIKRSQICLVYFESMSQNYLQDVEHLATNQENV